MPFLNQSWLNRIFASSCSRLSPLASSSLGNVNVCYLLYLFGCRCYVPKLLLRQEPRDSPLNKFFCEFSGGGKLGGAPASQPPHKQL